jgi:hypothetical protein
MAIDMGKVLAATPPVVIRLRPAGGGIEILFARDVDADVRGSLLGLREYGVRVDESGEGRTFDLWSAALDLASLAEQVAVSFEIDHGLVVRRMATFRDEVKQFTGVES